MAKRLVSPFVEVAPGVVVRPGDALPEIAFPAIVKPVCEGSSKGIRDGASVVSDAGALARQVRDVTGRYGQPALVEAYIEGAEVTAAVLGSEKPRVAALMQAIPRQGDPDRFVYSLEAKRDWRNRVRYAVPPELPPATLAALERAALAAFTALGCRDVARIDFRVTRDGRPVFLEANPLPGLSPDKGDIVIATRANGLAYDALIGEIAARAAGEAARAQASRESSRAAGLAQRLVDEPLDQRRVADSRVRGGEGDLLVGRQIGIGIHLHHDHAPLARQAQIDAPIAAQPERAPGGAGGFEHAPGERGRELARRNQRRAPGLGAVLVPLGGVGDELRPAGREERVVDLEDRQRRRLVRRTDERDAELAAFDERLDERRLAVARDQLARAPARRGLVRHDAVQIDAVAGVLARGLHDPGRLERRERFVAALEHDARRHGHAVRGEQGARHRLVERVRQGQRRRARVGDADPFEQHGDGGFHARVAADGLGEVEGHVGARALEIGAAGARDPASRTRA